jgi:hypothetical protein
MSKNIIITIVLILILAIGGGAGYYFYNANNSNSKPKILNTSPNKNQSSNVITSYSSQTIEKKPISVIKLKNEKTFTKTINTKSTLPLFWNGDTQKDEDAVYIVGVPNITTYSNTKDDLYARILDKKDIESDKQNPDYQTNLDILNNLDKIITKQSDEVEKLQQLYRTGIGGYSSKFVKNLDNYKLDGLDSQRAYLTLDGQSSPLSPTVNLFGKKNDQYIWITQNIYNYDNFPKDLTDKFLDKISLKEDQDIPTDLTKVQIELYDNDKATQEKIDQSAKSIVKKFELEK